MKNLTNFLKMVEAGVDLHLGSKPGGLFLPSYGVGRACEPVSFWQGNVIAIVIRSTQGSSKNVVVVETRLSLSSNVKLFMY